MDNTWKIVCFFNQIQPKIQQEKAWLKSALRGIETQQWKTGISSMQQLKSALRGIETKQHGEVHGQR